MQSAHRAKINLTHWFLARQRSIMWLSCLMASTHPIMKYTKPMAARNTGHLPPSMNPAMARNIPIIPAPVRPQPTNNHAVTVPLRIATFIILLSNLQTTPVVMSESESTLSSFAARRYVPDALSPGKALSFRQIIISKYK